MPIFDYKALSRDGKSQKGIVEAESAKAGRAKLKKQGLLVTEIREKNASRSANSGGLPFFSGKASIKDVSMMTRQLASLVKANIPLVECLNAMVEQTEKDALKVVLTRVRDDVNEGTSLAKAMAQHPRVYDTIFINMVEAGEASGTLGLVLLKLADLKEAQLRLKNKVVSGMTYPALMMVVAMGLLVGIFVFVIPRLTKIFDSMNKPIPAITKALILVSDLLTNWWFLFAFAGFVGATMFTRYINSKTGRPNWDSFKLRVPVVGHLVRMIAITRFASTMSTLLGSGVPILTAMAISRNLVGNVLISAAIEKARENITEGQSIADPLKRSGEFPPMVIHMIAIGERTGELPQMLANVSETYEEQVNAAIEGMTAMMEPLMIVGMGGVVGFIVVSIFIPLLEISNIQ
ncbi:MAG: type II secretion system inner membrane protein GspF [Bdellovibrionales bacterium]|nr:type II secretion system inner membrane protein GspF [Bdellovibrionales bacterium]